MSMLSVNGTEAFMSSNHRTAMYKGLTVAVYTVNKTDISLTRQDLVELINVCSVLPRLIRLIERVCLCPCKRGVCYGSSYVWKRNRNSFVRKHSANNSRDNKNPNCQKYCNSNSNCLDR